MWSSRMMHLDGASMSARGFTWKIKDLPKLKSQRALGESQGTGGEERERLLTRLGCTDTMTGMNGKWQSRRGARYMNL